MKRKILIISIIAGALLLTAGGITGFLIFNADAQEEEDNERGGKSWSPEIFFHVEEPMSTDVNIHIEDEVTLTIPEVENGEYASWRDIKVDANGLITYEDVDHQYLYYEGRFIHKYGESNYGWFIENIDGELHFQGEVIFQYDLLNILGSLFLDAGLEVNEAEVLLQRIIDNDMLSFSGNYLMIKYIPMKQVDQAIDLSTTYDINVVRRHFLIEETDEEQILQVPEFEQFNINEEYLIETAINRI